MPAPAAFTTIGRRPWRAADAVVVRVEDVEVGPWPRALVVVEEPTCSRRVWVPRGDRVAIAGWWYEVTRVDRLRTFSRVAGPSARPGRAPRRR